MKQTREMVEAKIRELGGYVDGGINWDWGVFPSNESAEEFHEWLGDEWETRGVYHETATQLAGVRYR